MNKKYDVDYTSPKEFKIVTLKYFCTEHEAWLCVARLKEVGIPSFLSNTNASTAFPFANGGIGLHVKAVDLEVSTKIIEKLEDPLSILHLEQSFHDADHDEIAYEKKVYEQKNGMTNPYWYMAIITISILIVIRAFVRAIGWASTFDPF